MAIQVLVILFFVCIMAAFNIAAIVTGRRSFAGASFSILLGFFASLGALHAWGESRSVPWTAGYGGFTLLCLIAAIVQLMPDRNRADRVAGNNAGTASDHNRSTTPDNS